ncbi:unnamed protein product [Rhizophagus irregularis]|nr:unnamed protein product [Rhizophagus irregularis]
MPLFNDEVPYEVVGHLDDRFVRISGLMPQFTPKQISHHWKNHLDPQLYCPKNKSTTNFWNLKRKSPENLFFASGRSYTSSIAADSNSCHNTNCNLTILSNLVMGKC